jgi:hypothetical protein
MSNNVAASLYDEKGCLYLAGEKIDGRTLIAKRFKSIAGELHAQIGTSISPSEKVLLRNTSILAVLCERDAAKLLEGGDIDEENYRRNVQALNAGLIKLGLAHQSRDMTKSMNRTKAFDQHAAMVLDAD